MKTTFLLALGMLLLGVTAQAQNREIYTNPQFSTIAKDHKTLAILPFKAIIKLRPKQMEQYTPEEYSEMLKQEGLAVQSAMHSYFLKRKGQHEFFVDFQDVNTTNAILAKNGVTDENITSFTPQELAGMLGVDGVVGGTLNTDKPMSDGAAIAMNVLVGFSGPTNSGKCTININDGASGALLWKYEKSLSRDLGSDTNSIINAMMRKASRKFPYNKM
ncbi:hypothetical protein [Cesiribacter andamanensis]|uniref:Secreted protein n=1 Tax=Cesiribacter andamanensis AMV16 TaxID=1279009 RepID=M7NU29_9BACT|nr:hypothetical protein [Cesiribacter andamanensis]EMR01999.1 hypothetical protein ADICEAN_02858 [Cesiribacter andamanensis AMV16]